MLRIALAVVVAVAMATAAGCSKEAASGASAARQPPASAPRAGEPADLDAAAAGDLGFGTNGDPNVRLEMHRRDAGDPDATGWCRAYSKAGGFAVDLPAPFHDFTMAAKAPDGVEVATHCTGTRDEGRTKFVATAMRGSDGRIRAASTGEILRSLVDRGMVVVSRPIYLDGFDCLEVELGGQTAAAMMRICLAGDTVYQLIVEPAPGAVLEGAADGARRFFNSFALVR